VSEYWLCSDNRAPERRISSLWRLVSNRPLTRRGPPVVESKWKDSAVSSDCDRTVLSCAVPDTRISWLNKTLHQSTRGWEHNSEPSLKGAIQDTNYLFNKRLLAWFQSSAGMYMSCTPFSDFTQRWLPKECRSENAYFSKSLYAKHLRSSRRSRRSLWLVYSRSTLSCRQYYVVCTAHMLPYFIMHRQFCAFGCKIVRTKGGAERMVTFHHIQYCYKMTGSAKLWGSKINRKHFQTPKYAVLKQHCRLVRINLQNVT